MVISSPLEEAIGVAAELDTQYDFFRIQMDGKIFQLISGSEKLSQDRTVSNSAEKHAANCSNQVTAVRKLPTRKHGCGFLLSKKERKYRISVFFADFRRRKIRRRIRLTDSAWGSMSGIPRRK